MGLAKGCALLVVLVFACLLEVGTSNDDDDVCCVLSVEKINCTCPAGGVCFERVIGPCPDPDCSPSGSSICIIRTYRDKMCATSQTKNVTVNFTLPCDYPASSALA